MVIKGNRFIISFICSAGIHLAIFLLFMCTIPSSLRVQELPGAIEVSLGARQGTTWEHSSTTARESVAMQQENKDQGMASKTGLTGRGDDERRGDSSLAVPKYEGNPKPPYPEAARHRGYEGTVKLQVEVLATGKVGKIEIKESSGHKELDQSALQAVKEWSFIPARLAGDPVKTTVIVPITFQLRDKLAAEIR